MKINSTKLSLKIEVFQTDEKGCKMLLTIELETLKIKEA